MNKREKDAQLRFQKGFGNFLGNHKSKNFEFWKLVFKKKTWPSLVHIRGLRNLYHTLGEEKESISII